MEIKLTVTGTRGMPTQISKADYDALTDPNTEVKVTLIAEAVSVENPVDSEEPLTVKLKVQHVDVVRTANYSD